MGDANELSRLENEMIKVLCNDIDREILIALENDTDLSNDSKIKSLKENIIEDIKSKIRTFFHDESEIMKDHMKEVNDEKEKNDFVISVMESDIKFLREEIKQKNRLIEMLVQRPFEKSVSDCNEIYGDSDSLDSTSIKSPSPSCHFSNISTTSNDVVNSRKSNFEDQIREVRKEYHKNYKAIKSKERNIKENDDVMRQHHSITDTTLGVNSIEKTNDIDLVDNLNGTQGYSGKKWPKDTTLIVGDSMLLGIDENRLSGIKKKSIKVRPFSGASIEDMMDHIKPLIRKSPTNMILHIGVNNVLEDDSQMILNKLLSLKALIEKNLPDCKLVISKIIQRFDKEGANSTIDDLNRSLDSLCLKTIDNSNITIQHLGKKGLHLNDWGRGRLALNFMKTLRKFN